MTDEKVGFEDNSDEAEGMAMNFDEVDETVNLIPKGKTLVDVEDLSYGLSNNSGNKMWTWVLTVAEGDHAGRKLFFHTVFEGNGLPRTKKTLQRIVPELVGGTFDPKKLADDGAMLGKQFTADVGMNKYQGTMRNQVKDLYPAGVAGGGGDAFLG